LFTQEEEMTTLKQIKDVVSADQISRQKDGSVMFRRGYFYHHGQTAEGFRDGISAALIKAGIDHRIEDCGDHWAAFRGGAGVKQNSHFYVRIVITSDENKAAIEDFNYVGSRHHY
jgi:hypothetical protein